MLCPKCDEYRFGKFYTKPETRSAIKAQANKDSIAASTPSTTTTTTTVNITDNKKANAPLQSEVDSLREEVTSLRASLALLESKVSYLLSFVGAVNCKPTPILVQTPDDDNWTTVGPNGRFVKSSTTSSSASINTNGSATVASKLCPTAAKSSSKVLQSYDRLWQDIVAAVYVDMHEKKRRANNVILSGLPPSDSIDDRTLVSQLLETELQCKPVIRGCK